MGEPKRVSGGAEDLLVPLYQAEPRIAARAESLAIAYQHLGADPLDPTGPSVELLWHTQLVLGGSYEGALPPNGPRVLHQRDGSIAPSPDGAIPTGNWHSQLLAVWSSTTSPGDWPNARIEAAVVCADNAHCGCVATTPSCEGRCWADNGCGQRVPCGGCGAGARCTETWTCECVFASCNGVCCAEGQVCSEGVNPHCCTPDCPTPGNECRFYSDPACRLATAAYCNKCISPGLAPATTAMPARSAIGARTATA
jgi:hypothetical protein